MDDFKGTLDWDAVYWEYMPRIYNYFRYRVGDDALAEDLTANTFVKAWKARNSYDRTRGAISTWLLTIARNTATDYYRRQRENLSLENVTLPIEDDRPVEESLELAQDFAQLRDLLEQLSARDRELIALKYGIGMTNRAVAKLLGVSESSVGTALYRAVKWLRGAWEGTPHE
ncbi:MAG: sigma-70 family RNA polymerase sigma factor [Armatimonadetes bacterium]|nr:sigma-70 family RNA polymerase sigma factor [Anaerolineae bacterium]